MIRNGRMSSWDLYKGLWKCNKEAFEPKKQTEKAVKAGMDAGFFFASFS